MPAERNFNPPSDKGTSSGASPEKPLPAQPPVAESQPTSPPAPGLPPPAGPDTPPPPRKGFPKIIFILAAILALLVLVFLLVRFVLPSMKKGKEIELTWWGLREEVIVAPLIAEYQETHPNVKINYVKQSSLDYRERLVNSLARGLGPDIFYFHNTWVPMFKNELDSIPASMMSAADFAEVFYPVALSDLSSGTGIVGIPLEYDALTLFVNEEIFAKIDKSPPTTWDGLRKTALELTIKDEKGSVVQAGVALGRTENVDHWQEILALMMLQNGASLSNPTGKPAEDALVFYTVFSSVDGVWDETLPSSTTVFASGKVAMYFGPSWRASEIKNQNPDLDFRTYPLPQLPKVGPTQPDVSYATYWIEGVWAGSPKKEVAWQFLKFLVSKESLEKLYQNAAKAQIFAKAYPRKDMAKLLITDPITGSIVTQAPDAQSWYLASETFDGPTGINSQISQYFEDAVEAINSGKRADKVLVPVASGVSQVLSDYGLRSP